MVLLLDNDMTVTQLFTMQRKDKESVLADAQVEVKIKR